MPIGKRTDHPFAANEILRLEFNKLLDNVRAIAVKLDAEVLAASDYEATVTAESVTLIGEER